MRSTLLFMTAAAILAVSACSSTSVMGEFEPELQIERIGGVTGTAQNVSGGIPVELRTAIYNPSGEPITLRRINISTLGEGGVTIPQTSRPFNVVIPANEERILEFWVPGYLTELSARSFLGSNTPMTIRAVAVFDSPLGSFQEIYTRQLGSASGQINPR